MTSVSFGLHLSPQDSFVRYYGLILLLFPVANILDFIDQIVKISMTSPIVINMPTRELLAGETNNSFVSRFEHLNNESNV